jgi:hypothetical protein
MATKRNSSARIARLPKRPMPFWPKDITVNLNITHSGSDSELLALLRQVFEQGKHIMAAVDDLKAILARIDTATSNIAQDIQDIKAKIGTGMTDAEVAEVQAGLEAAAAKLEALDAQNPEGTA